MKNLLYIGNILAGHGSNLTSIETLGPLLEKEGYHIVYASAKKSKPLRLLEMLWKTLRYSASTDYVLIDTYSTTNFWYAFLVSQLCRILRVKYIAKLHGGDLPNRLRRNPFLCKMIFNHSYVNVAPSGYLLDAFQKAGFPNVIYIPNTIELCNYQFKERKTVAPKLLWVRSFSPIYNPEMALKVLSLLKTDFPEAKLCMVGPDKYGNIAKMKNLAQQGQLDVTFTGRLSKEAWARLSADYDIFINTTHYDNTPVSVIEAMALGLPVVSTNVGGIPFLLEDSRTALLVNDSDVNQMTEAIKTLLTNDILPGHLANNALALVREFDSEKVKWKWFEILK